MKAIEAEVTQYIGAGRYERTAERTNQRNGSRPRQLDTPAGTLHLHIPKLRHGSFLPTLLEPRRRVDRALVNVVAQAYVHGVSTRKVDDLVRALGIDGIDKSTVSRMAQALDEDVQAFRSRPLADPYPYVWLDATFPKVREGGRVVSMALMIAVGVNDKGQRAVLGEDDPDFVEQGEHQGGDQAGQGPAGEKGRTRPWRASVSSALQSSRLMTSPVRSQRG
ncbi:MAG: transposase [Firmicutes bacterium]|nr:transposase [Bacillota bacterium]